MKQALTFLLAASLLAVMIVWLLIVFSLAVGEWIWALVSA